jgi:hypothetical protein
MDTKLQWPTWSLVAAFLIFMFAANEAGFHAGRSNPAADT